ncbi:MAG: hypothetical protein IJR44_05285 [Neisseriaceae bacterium]|nr:hypothetical protein [Neisseriaceae bacterium]
MSIFLSGHFPYRGHFPCEDNKNRHPESTSHAGGISHARIPFQAAFKIQTGNLKVFRLP